ncbi:MAG: hypothetical protein KJI72_00205 [Patescibacteria group bacterium]|nr:hypothetical protein [Patescibacteria group bacterium]
MSDVTRKYRVLKPIGFDGRKEVGEILEIDEVVAQNIGTDYLEEVKEGGGEGNPAPASPGEGEPAVNGEPSVGGEGGEVTKSQYKVLKELEYPEGTAHEEGAVLELTDEEAGKFAEGSIEKVEAGESGGKGN